MSAHDLKVIQSDPPPMADKTWDAIVVGAGPAGSTAAIRLSSAGFSVLLIDRKSFPRDKACGDGLIPDSIRLLRQLGLYDRVAAEAFSADHATIFSPGRISFDISGEFLVIKRRALDSILAVTAVERGAVFCRGRVTSVQTDTDGLGRVIVDGWSSGLRSRVVIIATGADISLMRPLQNAPDPPPSAFAVRAYVRSTLPLDKLVISFDRSIAPGYAWIFPLRGQEFNVGCGVFRVHGEAPRNLRATFESFITSFPLARRLLERGSVATGLIGARLRCGFTGAPLLAARNILVVGEAVGSTLPFTGEGIGKAMETALAAADAASSALTTGNLDSLRQYPEWVRGNLAPRYRGYQLAERWLSKPLLSDLLARRASRSSKLRSALEGVLAETANPAKVFSVRGVLGSILP